MRGKPIKLTPEEAIRQLYAAVVLVVQQPGRPRQLGVLHRAACGLRDLVTAAIALRQLASAMADGVALGRSAARSPKAIQPTRSRDRRSALPLGAKAAKELRDRQAALELDSVEGHGARSVVRPARLMGSVAHRLSQLRQVANQMHEWPLDVSEPTT